jgi:hypothetical protein
MNDALTLDAALTMQNCVHGVILVSEFHGTSPLRSDAHSSSTQAILHSYDDREKKK